MKISLSGHRMLDFDDSYEDNRKLFVQRLMRAGWIKKQAEKEYERIQSEEDDPS